MHNYINTNTHIFLYVCLCKCRCSVRLHNMKVLSVLFLACLNFNLIIYNKQLKIFYKCIDILILMSTR